MPSSLRSKTQSGPLKRSWVSVAAIGTTGSGRPLIASRRRRVGGEHARPAAERVLHGPGVDRDERVGPGAVVRAGGAQLERALEARSTCGAAGRAAARSATAVRASTWSWRMRPGSRADDLVDRPARGRPPRPRCRSPS